MTCPTCNADIAQKKVCTKCGMKIEPQGKIEITYKDYKISELLEIRHKRSELSAPSRQLLNPGKAAAETKRASVLSAKERDAHKKSRTVWGMVALIFAIAAGAVVFYLLR